MAQALRIRLAIGPDQAVEAAPRLRLEKRIPGGDDLPARPLAGLWIDLVDVNDEVVYSKVLDAVPDGTREIFAPRGTVIVRVEDRRPTKQYVVFVPLDAAPGGRLVVNSSDRVDRTARPIAEFSL